MKTFEIFRVVAPIIYQDFLFNDELLSLNMAIWSTRKTLRCQSDKVSENLHKTFEIREFYGSCLQKSLKYHFLPKMRSIEQICKLLAAQGKKN